MLFHVSCYFTLFHVILFHAYVNSRSCYFKLFHVISCYFIFILFHVISSYSMLFHVMLFQVIHVTSLYYVILCSYYFMLFYVISRYFMLFHVHFISCYFKLFHVHVISGYLQQHRPGTEVILIHVTEFAISPALTFTGQFINVPYIYMLIARSICSSPALYIDWR